MKSPFAAFLVIVLPSATLAQGLDLSRAQSKAAEVVKVAKSAVAPKGQPRVQEVVPVSDLLKGASEEARKEFLESMVIVGGKVASFSTGLLTRDLGAAKTRQIIDALNPGGAPAMRRGPSGQFQAMALCGGSTCDDTACHYGNDGKYCVDHKNSVCYSSCK